MKQTPGRTYKLRSPGVSDHAGYYTIVGGSEPVAFFFNSKEMKAFDWILTTMTSHSRQLRRGTKVEDVIKDMKESIGISNIIPDGSGLEVNSLVHHLGMIMEQHVIEENIATPITTGIVAGGN